MKFLRKISAVICAVALVVTSLAVCPDNAKADSSPKKIIGLVANTVSGPHKIDNAVMFAWAGADNPDNAAGYDPSVTSAVIYIYQGGKLVTKIGNATNGGVVGGLSAGNYTVKAANVNASGEGPLSDEITFTVTGDTLNYTYPVNCVGPKTPNGLNIITGNPEVPADNPAQADNKLGVAWAASSDNKVPAYDMSVVGYNIYIFDAEKGTPYRRVYVDGIAKSTEILESVSAGTYLVFLSAVNAEGEESALAAPSFTLASKVTVKGEKIDNAQSFDMPNQPTLPVGLQILTEGIQYGFTVAWAADADFTGQKLNLFVDGVCIKSGINLSGLKGAYYENRLAAGTYTVEVKSQYTENNVESFGLSKKITIAADPGLSTKTPAELADSSYTKYEGGTKPGTGETTPGAGETTPGAGETTTPGSVETTTPGSVETTTPGSVETTTPGSVETTTQAPTAIVPTTTTAAPEATTAKKLGKTTVKSASKKIASAKVKLTFNKVKGAKKYQVQIAKDKKFKKILAKKTVKKVKVTISGKKLKKQKKLFVRVRAVGADKWSKPKRIKIKK